MEKEDMSFQEYIELLHADARPARTAYQRIYDMIMAAGTENFREFKQDIVRFNFFSDVQDDQTYSRDSIFGLEQNLMELVGHFKSAAYKLGAEKRILLMHGPVGSSKSTIARLLKRGLEKDSLENPIYSFKWVNLGQIEGSKIVSNIDVDGVKLFDQKCQMHEDPIKLIHPSQRAGILAAINASNKGNEAMHYPVEIEGELCPHCRFNYRHLMHYYKGDISKVMEHVRVFRIRLSEADRIGVGTFQPKDEKNQDSTELTGNIDYRKIALFGSDSDPRAFNFDGELCIANRGIVEFIEILKLETAFLYDLLGASQEHQIKPKKFALTSIDEVILGHTNEEEYKKLKDDEMMKAFRDRTKRIDVPYNIKLSNEIKIYAKDYNARRVSKHIAPHTLEVAAMAAVISRLEGPKEEVAGKLTLMQKLKLYDGRRLQDYTDDTVKKLRDDAVREGLEGLSPRFIQDVLAESISRDEGANCVNPFMVLNRIKSNLKTSTLLNNAEEIKKYESYLEDIQKEYEDILKNEVQRAIVADPNDLAELCNKYFINVKAYLAKERVKNPITGKDEQPDEMLMRSIEQKIGITDAQKDAFRAEKMQFISYLMLEGKQFDFNADEELKKALQKKLFDDQKEKVNFKSLFTGTVDPKEQEKIDMLTKRLIDNFGYCKHCANDILEYVAGIFARGDVEHRRK